MSFWARKRRLARIFRKATEARKKSVLGYYVQSLNYSYAEMLPYPWGKVPSGENKGRQRETNIL